MHFLIQGASGFKGIAFTVNYSNTLLSTHGIILGGFINGKLNDGFKYRQPEKPVNWNFTKEKKLHNLDYYGNTLRVTFYF